MDTENESTFNGQTTTDTNPAGGNDSLAMRELFGIKSFRNLWLAAAISQMGDVCFIVALPWLVLQLTGSGLALGSVMMALAAPRALLLLLGGAISDRLPARTVLATALSAQAICVGAAAVFIWQGALQLEVLLVLALCFGIADAFTSPAMHVLLPSLVKPQQLPAANALIESTSQICLLAGAAVVGLLIAEWGILFAFVVDALSYVSMILVLLTLPRTQRTEAGTQSMRTAIWNGLRYVWDDTSLRTLLIIIASVNFCVAGVSQVGFAALASFRFGSPTDLGFLMMSMGIGTIAGLGIAGATGPKPSVMLSALYASIALSFLLAAFAVPLPVWWACLVALGIGVVAGLVNVQAVSWLQATVKPDMLGRVMSVLELASAGVIPLSVMIAGILAEVHMDLLFVSAGAVLLLLTVAIRLVRRIDR